MIASEKCPVCGKRGKRPCPATGGVICAACCGANRGSKLNCPPECSFYPFGTAGYDHWIEVDETWGSKAFKHLDQQLGPKVMADLISRFTPRSTTDQHEQFITAVPSALYYGLFFHRDSEGKTQAGRWEAQGWAGLNNDERLMMQYARGLKATVIEVQRALDTQSVECLDLLAPGSQPFVLFDRPAARNLPRFTKLFVWLTHFPHFARMSPAAFQIGDVISDHWLKIVHAQWKDDQKTRPELTLHLFLAERFTACADLISALTAESRKRLLESLDLHHCVAEFSLTGKMEEAKAILDGKPELLPEPPKATKGFELPEFVYVWLRKGESEKLEKSPHASHFTQPGAEEVIGTIRLYPKKLALETFSKRKYDFARSMLEQFLGQLVHFETESVVDLSKQLSEREKLWPDQENKASLGAPVSSPDAPAVVSETRREALWKTHRSYFTKLLDENVPMLDGLTPRAAAQDPARRPQLTEFLKAHLHHLDTVNRREGFDLNIDWVLDELGFPELK